MYRPAAQRYSPSRAVEDEGYYDPGRASREHERREHERDSRVRDRYERERSPRRGSGYDDDRVPPPRRYDDDRVPPPRRYDDDRVPPPRRYDDRDRDYDRDRDREREREFDRGRRYDDDRRPRRHDDYRDRDRDGNQDRDWDRDRSHRDRDGGRDRDREQPSSPSSRDVIFLGLDPQLTETELAGFLRTEHGASLESTKIVRDRNGQSKCFGFAMFATLRDAEQFVYDNYPTISMPALYAHSVGKRVKIDFAGSRGERDASGGGSAIAPVRGHDGTRDIGQPDGTQRVLLLRGLDPGTFSGEVARRIADEIAVMLGKDVRQADGAITRVAMIVDRSTEALWSFAFVELATPELAAALLPFLLSPQHQPNGFLIAGVPIAASFANGGAFVPATPGPHGTQYLLRAAPNGGIGSATIGTPEGEWCTYWHQAAGAVETIPRGAPSVPARGSPLVLSDELKAFLGSLAGAQAQAQPPAGLAPVSFGTAAAAAVAAAPVATSSSDAAPLGMQPIKIGINLGGGATAKKKGPVVPEDGIIPISHKNVLGEDDNDGDPGKDSVLLSRTKGAKIIPPTSTSRKIAKNISKWNTKQNELAAPAPPKDPHAPPRGASSANATAVGVRPPAAAAAAPAQSSAPAPAPPSASTPADTFDYTDVTTFAKTGKVACLLCQRQFKTEEMLRTHVATNLADPAIREAARKRKEAAVGAATSNTESSEPSEPKYRDRAAERREVFHQPEKPKLPPPTYKKGGFKPVTSATDANPAPPSAPPPAPPSAPAANESNVGSKLLARMGWTAGTGLGASSEGRVDPIKVQQFDERVGLGAAKGREAGKWSGPGGWNERKKDMTKERYEAADK